MQTTYLLTSKNGFFGLVGFFMAAKNERTKICGLILAFSKHLYG